MKVYRGSKETKIIGDSVIVYKNPIADFILLSDTVQCLQNNNYCLIDNTNSKVKKVNIDWGNGILDRGSPHDTFCMNFYLSGNYEITYKVTDENDCTNQKISYFKTEKEQDKDLGLTYNTISFDSVEQEYSYEVKYNSLFGQNTKAGNLKIDPIVNSKDSHPQMAKLMDFFITLTRTMQDSIGLLM